jgi:protein-arginine kinase activator protein McsA
MRCQDCGQEEATVHVTKIESGHPSERHICEKCSDTESGYELMKKEGIFRLVMEIHGKKYSADLKRVKTDEGFGLYCPHCNEELTKEQK